MTPRAVEMVPILHPAFARVRIANEIRMQFRRERKSGQHRLLTGNTWRRTGTRR